MNFEEHLKAYLNKKEIDDLLNSLARPSLNAALLNLRKMDDKTFVSLFPNVIPHPYVKHAYIYDKEEYPLGKSIYHELGCFYLQEPSAMMPAYLLHAQDNDFVLDMCAAPGGKSIQSSFLMDNKGLIIANDISYKRAESIRDNVERLGIGNLAIINKDLCEFLPIFKESFDKIILDAPCSGSGMFRKNDLMKDDWSYNKVLKFQETQKQLILNAYQYLKPGGIICYSTCSFSKEEDEDVVSYLLANSDAILLDIDDNPLFYKSPSKIGIHLFPHLFPGEGHYIALIKKPGEIKKKNNETKHDKWIKQIDNVNDYHYSFHYDDVCFLASEYFSLKNLPLIRYGAKVGELINNEFRFNYHYAHFLSSYEKEYELNDEELNKYLKGETIDVSLTKGEVLIKYKTISVDFARSDGRILKNRYPKYLRRR